jgi:hypothetical protein
MRVRDIGAKNRPVTDWLRLTGFLAGRLDQFGGWQLLSPAKRKSSWRQLKAKYRQDVTVVLVPNAESL